MPLHLLQKFELKLSDCNNFWYTYYSDNRSSKGSFIFHTARCLRNYLTLENKEREKSHISQYAASYFAKKKLDNLFHTNVPSIIHVFKMSSLCTYERFKPLSSLVGSRVGDVLLQIIPDINETLLQLIDVIQTAFAESLLRDSPLHIL